jgi:GntR family transcriptional regulator
MILKQMVDDTSYYKSLGLTIEEVFELMRKVY